MIYDIPITHAHTQNINLRFRQSQRPLEKNALNLSNPVMFVYELEKRINGQAKLGEFTCFYLPVATLRKLKIPRTG